MTWIGLVLPFLAGACLIAGSLESAITDRISRSVVYPMIRNRLKSPLHYRNSRRPRQADQDENVIDESTMCVMQCTAQLQSASARFQQLIGPNGTVDDDHTMLKPNLTLFMEACHTFRPSLRCFDQCSSSRLLNQLKPMLDPPRYMCFERYEDIRNNAQCHARMTSSINNHCRPRCREYEDSVRRLKQFIARSYSGYQNPVSDIRDLLSGTCQFIQCQMDCGDPITRRGCGDTAADLIKTLTQKSISLAASVGLMSPGSDHLWPPACRRLAEGRDPLAVDGDDSGESSDRGGVSGNRYYY